MNVKLLDAQIQKELACIDYLYKRIRTLHRRGLYDLAIVYFQDIRKSEQQIAELKIQKDEIRLAQSRYYNTVQSLNKRGIQTKPVRMVRSNGESMASC